MGEGFALRWCFGHDIVIGSRDDKGPKRRPNKYKITAQEAYGNGNDGNITGQDNFFASKIL